MSNVVIKDYGYFNDDALENIVAYGLRIEKYELNIPSPCIWWGGSGVLLSTPQAAINCFKATKRLCEKDNGNILHHVIITLNERYEVNNAQFEAREIAKEISIELGNAGFQNLFFIHCEEVGKAHIHLVLNSINFLTGNRISSTGWLGNTILTYLKLNFNNFNWGNNPIYDKEKYYRTY